MSVCLHGTGSLYSRLLYIQEGNALKGTCKDLTARGWETKGKYSEKNIILYGGSRSTIFKVRCFYRVTKFEKPVFHRYSSSFYDAMSVTRLYSVDYMVISE